jgi:predicted DsbA family dithiol-disulfide isomerase
VGELKRFFASTEGASAVREEEERARTLGISGVPFYVINDTPSFSGAQRPEICLEALRTTTARKSVSGSPDDVAQACGPDGCKVPKK